MFTKVLLFNSLFWNIQLHFNLFVWQFIIIRKFFSCQLWATSVNLRTLIITQQFKSDCRSYTHCWDPGILHYLQGHYYIRGIGRQVFFSFDWTPLIQSYTWNPDLLVIIASKNVYPCHGYHHIDRIRRQGITYWLHKVIIDQRFKPDSCSYNHCGDLPVAQWPLHTGMIGRHNIYSLQHW